MNSIQKYFKGRTIPHWLSVLALLLSGGVSVRGALFGGPLTGEKIYQKQCVKCHGAKGEGVKGKRSEPLVGDWSLAKLTEVIAKTMPDDKPGTCTGVNAEKVSRYIYDAFYSPEAQVRLHPPRIELARLTNRQYLCSVADLLRNSDERVIGSERGLTANYYNAKNTRGDKKVFSRVDALVDFQFGEGTPDDTKFGKEEFAIQWSGSVLPVETGEYEFILKTENGARLWVNAPEHVLIDGGVASGGLREQRATLRLIGGRAYPLRLEFFKAKDKTASISLQWKPPHGVQQIIPQRCLSPVNPAPTLVVTTPFPADDSSGGYERGTTISAAWDEATTSAAIEVANHLIANLDALTKSKPADAERKDKVMKFCQNFVERAFRRPLSLEQKRAFVESHFAAANDVETATKRVVLLALKSPRFLYPDLQLGAIDDYAVAGRLALELWDSLPDAPLTKIAAEGNLHTREQVAQQAARMVSDPRTRAKLRQHLHHWLRVDQAEEISKNAETFPGFDGVMIADLRASLDVFLDHVIWENTADYRQLLLADYLFVNERLAKFYGLDAPEKSGEFTKVSLTAQPRAGVITHPYLLAIFAYHNATSPIHRGVFLTRSIVGRSLKAPPMAVAFKDEEFDPHLTMREKISKLTRSETCQSCHSVINPLGFTLENFDAVGRFRTEEKGKAIDATSVYPSPSGDPIRLGGARDLARYAAQDTRAQENFIEQLFNSFVKQPVRAYGADALPKLQKAFVESECNVQKLLIEIATLSATFENDPKPLKK